MGLSSFCMLKSRMQMFLAFQRRDVSTGFDARLRGVIQCSAVLAPCDGDPVM